MPERPSLDGAACSEIPAAVRLALIVLLNHTEPGWENCRELVRRWVYGESLVRDGDRLAEPADG
jgi:hypothetical protein